MKQPTQQPTTKQPTTKQPTTKQPTTKQPTTKQPTTENPTTENPTTERPTTKQPTTEQPTDKAVTDSPAASSTDAPTNIQVDLITDDESIEDEPRMTYHDKLVYGIAGGAGGFVFIAIVIGAVVMKRRSRTPRTESIDGMRYTGNPLYDPKLPPPYFKAVGKTKKHFRGHSAPEI